MKKTMVFLGLIFLLFSQSFAADSGAPMRKHELLDGNWHSNTTKGTPSNGDVPKYNLTTSEWEAGAVDSIKSKDSTGVVQVTGPAAGTTRVMTVPDADVTLLYSGGALGTPASGNASNLTDFPTLNQDTTGYAADLTTAAMTAFVDQDATPALTAKKRFYKTANTVLTTYTDFNDGAHADGNWFILLINDAFSKIDATGSNVKLVSGTDTGTLTAGDLLLCVDDGTNWYCMIQSGSTSTANWNTTGTISGGMPSVGTSTFAAPITTNPYTFAAADMYGKILYYGATGTINLETLVKSMSFCIYNTGAFTITVNPQDTDVLVIDGTANAAGHYLQIPSGAGNFVCLHADAAGHAVTLGEKGTLVAE